MSDNDDENNVLNYCKLKEKEEKKDHKNDDLIISEDEVRELTSIEKEYIKTQIPLLEEHERIQIFHFIRIDKIKYTKSQNGILVNLKNTNDTFNYKIYKFVKRCIENQKYTKI